MLPALVVLWLGAPAELGVHRAELVDWASAHALRVVSPAAAPGPRYDARLAEEVEVLLEQARTEAPATPSALERAEAILLAHPELPQAAWLLSERYALEAQAAAARGEPAPDLGGRAAALEGERATTAGVLPATLGVPAAGTPVAPLRLSGARQLDRLYIDGVLAGPDRLVASGRHHLQLVRGGVTVHAAWVEAGPGLEPLLVDPTLACGALDLAGVTSSRAGALELPPGILCERWAAARRSSLGGAEIARCEGSRCGPWEPARTPLAPATTGASVIDTEPASPWPGWLTWSLLGVGAAAATGLVLWQAGAFDQPAPSTEFVFSGPDAAAYHF